MTVRIPKLILIAGLPGTGKSFLARALSGKLSIPLLEKDSVKETLADTLSTPWCSEWSAELGAAAEESVFRLAALQLKMGLDVIIDTPMMYSRSWDRLRDSLAEIDFKLHVIVCDCSDTDLRERLKLRAKNRHGIHRFRGQDADRILLQREEFESLLGEQEVPVLRIATSRPVHELFIQCETFLDRTSAGKAVPPRAD